MRSRLDKVDWKALRENKRLKLYIGLSVVLVLFFAFFVDVIFSIYKFRYYTEEQPREKKVIKEKVRRLVPEKGAPAGKMKASKKKVVKIAIILDDAGGKIPDYSRIFSIKERLTISIIPHLPSTPNIAKASKDAGLEVILHLPMEPDNGNYVTTGNGMVVSSAGEAEIERIVLDDLSDVKWAVGFNNHMGSKVTKDEKVMKAVFSSLKGKKLYFIDSKTSDKSVAYKIAKSLGLRSAENDVFLDGGTSEADIESKFKHLISVARRRGSAIGIGHATRPLTIEVLRRLMPEYSMNGIKFVHASELVK